MRALVAARAKPKETQPVEAVAVAGAAEKAEKEPKNDKNPPPKNDEDNNEEKRTASGKRVTDRIVQKRGEPKKRKANARDIRLAKDWAEYQDCKGLKVEFPDPQDTSVFNISVTPQDGYWKNATFVFSATVPLEYPHSPPAIVLKTVPIYHPNINFEGKICLNVLRDGWQPVMTITHVLYGLLLLFEHPNPHDPLPNGIDAEWEAANLLRKDPKKFEEMVNSTLEGGLVRRLNKTFPVLKKPSGRR